MADESKLSVDEKMEFITRGLEEVIDTDGRMRSILAKRDLKLYWGTAATGAPHVAYFVPMSKIADFLRAGCDCTILIADLHAQLDNLKSSPELVEARSDYYEAVIKAMLRSIGVPLDKLKFVRGSSYQLTQKYTMDVYKLCTLVTLKQATKAGAEVVKQVESPLLSGMVYPLLQALDEEYLKVDAQFGGSDQRKIFTFAREQLPRLGYGKRIHLMNPMVPGLSGGKMSSSEANSKIDLLDSAKQVKKKIGQAFCEEGNIDKNGVLSFAKHVLFPLRMAKNETFDILRDPKWGGDLKFATYEELEQAFAEKKVHPADLKGAVIQQLNALLKPIREEFKSKKLQALLARAYPKQHGGGKKKNASSPVDITGADLRVGVIKEVKPHPAGGNLCVTSVDLGEKNPRQIVAGFYHVLKEEQLVGAKVVVLSNVKGSKFKGELSQGVIIAATDKNEQKESIELVSPPAACAPGDRITFPGYDTLDVVPIYHPKKKVFQSKVLPDLKVNDDLVAVYKEAAFTTAHGVCTVKTLKGCPLK